MARNMAADIDCDRQTGYMGGESLNGDCESRSLAAETLRPDAKGIHLIENLFFHICIEFITVRLADRSA